MNTLIVCDVFDAYYDGRKSAFVSSALADAEAEARRKAKREDAANSDKTGKQPRAA